MKIENGKTWLVLAMIMVFGTLVYAMLGAFWVYVIYGTTSIYCIYEAYKMEKMKFDKEFGKK